MNSNRSKLAKLVKTKCIGSSIISKHPLFNPYKLGFVAHSINLKHPFLYSTGIRSHFNSDADSSVYPRFRPRVPFNTMLNFIPQQQAYIVERFGRFYKILQPGIAWLLPFIDRIKYVHSLKEKAVSIPHQTAITKDNVTLKMDGVLYYRIIDPYKASYGVEDAHFAIAQLAQTTMRAEIGNMSLDLTLSDRQSLNTRIVRSIDSAAGDIQPPENVVKSMHSLVSTERSKRATILESEGKRQADINVAEGQKQAEVLRSEADMIRNINKAKGEAQSIILRADASKKFITEVASAINQKEGSSAVSMQIANSYVDAFANLAKQGNSIIVPSDANNIAQMVTKVIC